MTPLATYLNSPILLVEKNYIPIETINEIKRLGTKKVIIAGGEGVVSKNVQLQLIKLGINNIIRLAGENRYETSLEIAKYIDKNCYDIANVVLANGYAEADAMSISAISGRDKMPIILTEAHNLNSQTYKWLKSENLNNAYIIGGTGVITENLLNNINSITKLDIRNNRIGGANRYETNALVIGRFYGNNTNKIYVSKGLELVDALASGPVAALNSGIVVIADNDLSISQKNVLSSKSSNSIIEVGGGISKTAINSLIDVLK